MSGGLSGMWKAVSAEWSKLSKAPEDAAGLARLEKMTTELKVELLCSSKMVRVLGSAAGGGAETAEALVVYRSVLEVSAQLAALRGDVEVFQRRMEQLLAAYAAAAKTLPAALAVSDERSHLLGLGLMAHLAQKNLGPFHMALDAVPAEERGHACVDWPVQLEKALVLGTYARVFTAGQSMPRPTFRAFFARLVETVRGEIGACFEATYEELSVDEAARLLFLSPDEAKEKVAALAEKRGWPLEGDKLLLSSAAALPARSDADAANPANLTADHSHLKRLLNYATLLEAIP